MGKYKGEQVLQKEGQYRAHKLYPIMGTCEMCDKPALDIHHKDRNRLNNKRSNVRFLCRTHHMLVDGRLRTLQINGTNARKPNPKPCVNCGDIVITLRKGKCHACNEYFRRNGKDRLTRIIDNIKTQPCLNCGKIFTIKNRHKSYCPKCTRKIYLEKHALSERNRRSKAHGIKEV